MKRLFAYIGSGVLSLCFAGNDGFAQTGNAQLGGIVLDQSRALIPGVSITATNVDINVTSSQVTNETGTYSFPVLRPGTYRVSAELPGFKRAAADSILRESSPSVAQVRPYGKMGTNLSGVAK